MKLLFVHERLGAFGGAETNLHQTARELASRGHIPGLLHGLATGQDAEDWRQVFPFRFHLAPEAAAESVRQAIAKFEPDLIYMHKMADLKAIEALVASRLPLVRMVHDHDLYCMRSYKYNPLSRAICQRPVSPYCLFPCGAFFARHRGDGLPIRWVSYAAKQTELQLNRRCHRLIVATNYMRHELVQNGFDQQKVEVHPPVPRRLAEPPGHRGSQAENPPASPGSPLKLRSSFSDRNVIIFAGQIIRGKGVDVLLESLALIKVPFEAFILGDGNHRVHCEKLSRRLGLGGRVHFPGFLPHNELQPYFLEASAAVLSSVWPEPFGAVGLEGMRYGLPVVAFDAGGIREWLVSGYNGYLVPWMDRASFAARVEELLLDKNLARQLGERGANLVARRFDFSNYITGLEGTFAKVVDEARGVTA